MDETRWNATQWNAGHAIGTRVRVTLANGKVLRTRTLGPAQRWGGLDHVQVAGTSGFVLLSWVAPDEEGAVHEA